MKKNGESLDEVLSSTHTAVYITLCLFTRMISFFMLFSGVQLTIRKYVSRQKFKIGLRMKASKIATQSYSQWEMWKFSRGKRGTHDSQWHNCTRLKHGKITLSPHRCGLIACYILELNKNWILKLSVVHASSQARFLNVC